MFGAQLGNGSMGNARWVGVPLRAVLEKAGVLSGAKQVSFNGLDTPVRPKTPDFLKVLDIDLALSAEPLIAWSMNGTAIPFFNGHPIELNVPGYFGTYWVKHMNEIEVLDQGFEGFFMSTAYRVPDNACMCVPAGTASTAARPITSLAADVRAPVSRAVQIRALLLMRAAVSRRWRCLKTTSSGGLPLWTKTWGAFRFVGGARPSHPGKKVP